MEDSLISQLLGYFKTSYGLAIENATELFETQRNWLEYWLRIGRELENRLFEHIGKGYEVATVEKDSRKYSFVGHRRNTFMDCLVRSATNTPTMLVAKKGVEATSLWTSGWA